MRSLKTYCFLVVLLLLGCSAEKKEVAEAETQAEVEVEAEAENEILVEERLAEERLAEERLAEESFFPAEHSTTNTDTTVQGMEISIERRSLDSYVVNEFESESGKFLHKYRDFEYSIQVANSDGTFVDELLRKENFESFTGQEFLEIANFYNYWFREVKGDTVVFMGTITKPETDWAYSFFHKFSLSTGDAVVEELPHEEI